MLNYQPYIPKTVDEVVDQLAFMFAKSPTFEDSFFVGRNIDTVFAQLSAGLENIRTKLGEERYAALAELSIQTRSHFEADPEDINGRAREGRLLIQRMREIIEPRLSSGS